MKGGNFSCTNQNYAMNLFSAKIYALIFVSFYIKFANSEKESILKDNEVKFFDEYGTTVFTIFSKSGHHTFSEHVTFPKIPCTKVSIS